MTDKLVVKLITGAYTLAGLGLAVAAYCVQAHM